MPNIPDVEIDLTPEDVRLVIEAGWAATLEFEFVPADIVGWTAWGLQTRPQRGATHGQLDWTPDATEQATTGIIRFSITAAQSLTIKDGGWWEWGATVAGVATPLARGPVVVKPNIKR